MPTRQPQIRLAQRRCSGAAICVVALAAACDIGNFGDLGEKLLDPDVQGLDVPGERWLEGAHYDLSIQADEEGRRFAVARNEASELAIIDFQNQTHCRTGVVARYGSEAIIAPSRPALVPLLVQVGDNAIALGFSDFSCAQSAFSVPVSGLPGMPIKGLPDGSGTALLARTPEQGLILVDPWAETTRKLAESVRSGDPLEAFGHFLWVDRGVITISDSKLEPIAYFGQAVTEISVSPEDAELAYIEANPDGSRGGTLFTVTATGSEAPRQVAADACNVRYLSVGGRRHLSYLSPCAVRRLVLEDRADDSIRVIDVNVAGSPAVRNVDGESFMTYVTTEDVNSASGTLWLVKGQGEAIAIAENSPVPQMTTTVGGGLITLVDLASNGGRLMEWNDDALTELARDVVEIDPVGRLKDDLTLLGNYDGVTGDLLRLKPDRSTEVLARGVPKRAANDDAFLANFDGTTGELMLLDRTDGSSESLATGVARGSFIFAQQFSAIMMLSARDDETHTSTLHMRLLESKRNFVVHDGVTEAREVAFPSPGILYNVVVGDDAGVWFSKTL